MRSDSQAQTYHSARGLATPAARPSGYARRTPFARRGRRHATPGERAAPFRRIARPCAASAAAIDDFAAQPERVHKASNLDYGVSPWNARPEPEPSAAYWSPLPDPEPKETQGWRHSIYDSGWRVSRH